MKYTNEQIIQLTADRGVKWKAPEKLQPTVKFANTAETLTYYINRRDSTIVYTGAPQHDLKNCFIVHPLLGTLGL